ncbi:MAG: UDP-N-acetylmuramate dehydrogenase [Candidatus Anammoxibacter sp.]
MPLNEITSFLKTDLKNSTVRFNERMSLYTSFKIGGVADAVVSPGSFDDLKKVVKIAHKTQIPLNVLGNGTNLLVSDEGVKSIVLDCKTALSSIAFNGRRVTVGAGCTLKTLAEEAAKRGLSGVELAVGIPGSVGGALIMNAGAYDYNIGNIVENVTVMDMEGNTFVMDKKNLSFDYRRSNLKDANYIILNAELALEKGETKRLFKFMQDELESRTKKFPLDYPNAGSIFKRPESGYPGKWIEMADCKGLRVGDAEVSTKHANFIINRGRAKASDVLQLIDKVQKIVFDKFNVSLEQEIIFWGA